MESYRVTYQQNDCPGQRYPVVSMYRPIPGVHISGGASAPEASVGSFPGLQEPITKMQGTKTSLSSAPAFIPKGGGGCWCGTQAWSRGSRCRGLSPGGPSFPHPPPGQALLDIPGTTLMGSRVPILAFFSFELSF